MAFNLFKKKKEVVDFTPKDSNMPIPAKMKDKLMAGNSQSTLSSVNTSSPTSTTQNSGGFFSFFGGGSDNTANSTAPSSTGASDSNLSMLGSGSTVNPSPASNEKLESQLSDLTYRLSRLTDRIELIERKIDRVERKLGIIGEEQA